MHVLGKAIATLKKKREKLEKKAAKTGEGKTGGGSKEGVVGSLAPSAT